MSENTLPRGSQWRPEFPWEPDSSWKSDFELGFEPWLNECHKCSGKFFGAKYRNLCKECYEKSRVH